MYIECVEVKVHLILAQTFDYRWFVGTVPFFINNSWLNPGLVTCFHP